MNFGTIDTLGKCTEQQMPGEADFTANAVRGGFNFHHQEDQSQDVSIYAWLPLETSDKKRLKRNSSLRIYCFQ